MTDYADIIARLERATGEDRSLDIAISYACLPLHHSGRWSVVTAPAFTASVDAALTLFPDGVWLNFKSGTQTRSPSWEWPVVAVGRQSDGKQIWKGQAKTIPLTMCLAAFHIRAASPPPSDDTRDR